MPTPRNESTSPFVASLLLFLVSSAGAAPGVAQDLPTLRPGDGRVDGGRLAAYSAAWGQSVPGEDGWVPRAEITEDLEARPDRWIRVQRTRQGPVELIVEVELDKASLRPISLRRYFASGVPDAVTQQLAQAGFAKEIEVEFGATDYQVRTTPFAGEDEVVRGDMGMPFFEASTLGLVLAATELGGGARFPVLFVNGSDGAVTEYWIDGVSADATELIAGVEAVRVDVAWFDFAGGGIQSEAGPDAAGGAYWVSTGPEGGGAPVPRYRNESVDIVLRGGQ